ncbi:hypothetical protein A4X09_0g2194 [Tilletia walkeri]|uniref:C2 NT-type domain-containing protein n=1 Tax=Tilletia walkeri TaxID=117179 RepID=A0A8X7ND79_9BASI|nr:hypothetical protein A4X09_0g2194 [Tilletia walkeri]
MASLLNPFGFGQKHAYFYVRLTIHELKNVPLISGEFQVKWKFKQTHPIADVPGIALTHPQQPVASSSASITSSSAGTSTIAAATTDHNKKKQHKQPKQKSPSKYKSAPTSASSSHPASAQQSQVTSQNASSVDLLSASTEAASAATTAGSSTSNLTTADSASTTSSSQHPQQQQPAPEEGEKDKQDQPASQEQPQQQQQQAKQQQHHSNSGFRNPFTWHQPHPEARGFTDLCEVKEHSVRWQRQIEVGLKMNVERPNTNSHNHNKNHRSRGGAGGLGEGTSGIAAGSSSASIRSLGSTSYRADRGDDSRSLKGSTSGTGLDSHDHDRRDDAHRAEMWGNLSRCEVKLTVKQRIDTSSHSSHTMAPPNLGYVNLNLAEFAPYSHPTQAHHHHHFDHLPHHHLSHHHHHHLHHHREIDPKQTLFRSETRRFLLNESRTNASLKITVEIVHIGGSRQYTVPTLKDGIIISSSDHNPSDFPLLPFVNPGRDDPGHATASLPRDAKDRKDSEVPQSKNSTGDTSLESSSHHNNHNSASKSYAASIGGEPYRERASSSVSSFDTRSARSINLAGTSTEYAALGVPSRASKALTAGLTSRSGSNYPFSFNAPRSVSGHTRIPSQNLRNPEAVKEQKAKQRWTAGRKELGTGEGTELSPEEIVRDLFRSQPKHLVIKQEEDKKEGDGKPKQSEQDAVEYLQVTTRPAVARSGELSGRINSDGRSLGSNLPSGLFRRPSSSSTSSRSTGGSERPSIQLSRASGGGDDGASISARSVQTLSTVGEFGHSSSPSRPSKKGNMLRSDSASALADLSVMSEPGDIRRGSAGSTKDEKTVSSSSKKGHARTSSATSNSTMRSILSTKSIAAVLTKRQNSYSKKKEPVVAGSTPPTAIITRQSGPKLAPGLLSSTSVNKISTDPATLSSSMLVPGRSPTARGPSIRWDLGGLISTSTSAVSPAPISPISSQSASGSIASAPVEAPLDVVTSSSRVHGTEGSQHPSSSSLALNPPIVAALESPVSELPSPVGIEQSDEADAAAAATAVATAAIVAAAASNGSNKQQTRTAGSSPQPPKRSKWPLAGADKSNWRGAGWRADLDVPHLDQDVYMRPSWPATLLPSSASLTSSPDALDPFTHSAAGLPPKVRGTSSMAIYRFNPRVSSPPEDGNDLGALVGSKVTPAGLAERLAGDVVDINFATKTRTVDRLLYASPYDIRSKNNKQPSSGPPVPHFSISDTSSGSAYVMSSEPEDDDDDDNDDDDDDDDDDEGRCYEDARQSVMLDREMGS